jgi:hypothetical protein
MRTIGAPPPEINGKVLGIERDFVWRAQRLVVETDGGTFHLPKAARERDYEDDARLVVLRSLPSSALAHAVAELRVGLGREQ